MGNKIPWIFSINILQVEGYGEGRRHRGVRYNTAELKPFWH
jgi:hypothetical protein